MVPATPLIMAGCGVLQIAGCGVRFRILGRWKGQNFFQLWFACCVSLQFHIVQVQHVSLPTYVEGYLSVWSLSLSFVVVFVDKVALLAASCFLVPKTSPHGGTFDLSCVCTDWGRMDPVGGWHGANKTCARMTRANTRRDEWITFGSRQRGPKTRLYSWLPSKKNK